MSQLTAKEITEIVAAALSDKKGQDIKALHTADLTTLAEYFVICTGTSSTQIKALSDAVEKAMSEAGEEPHHIEGHRGGTWVLLDYSCVVVHIFTEETRQFYDLERLWRDAEEVDLSAVLTKD